MTSVKTKTAEALLPLLSAFHDVNGMKLRAVCSGESEDLLSSIAFDFGTKALVIRADEEDDTVELSTIDSTALKNRDDASGVHPWNIVIGQQFGWGWVTVNQQGYLDGVLLSFGGIMPQFLVTVVASSLKVSEINIRERTPVTN